MDNIEYFLSNIENLSQTKIYLIFCDAYTYGTKPDAKEKISEINHEIKLSVYPEEKFESVKNLVIEFFKLNNENVYLKEEIFNNKRETYTIMEIAKLSLLNFEIEELNSTFLKIFDETIRNEGSYVLLKKEDTIFSAKEIEDDKKEYIINFLTENVEKFDIFLDRYQKINQGCFLIGYNFGENESVAVFIKENDIEYFNEKETLFKIMMEEFKIVLQNRNYRKNLEELYFKILKRVASIINKRNYVLGDKYSIDEFIKVAQVIAKNYGLSKEDVNRLNIISTLKDVGTLLIPENILHKIGTLTADEYRILRKHPIFSSNILEQTEYFENVILEIKHHHEKWNGEGYPNGLRAKEIPILARIIHLTDTFLALTSERVYRKMNFTMEKALDIIVQNKYNHFDPELVEVFVLSFEEIKGIIKNNS